MRKAPRRAVCTARSGSRSVLVVHIGSTVWYSVHPARLKQDIVAFERNVLIRTRLLRAAEPARLRDSAGAVLGDKFRLSLGMSASHRHNGRLVTAFKSKRAC